MLEAFLRQAEAPVSSVFTEQYDWVIYLAVFFGGLHYAGIWVALIASAVLSGLITSIRKMAIARQPASYRLAIERWIRIERLQKLSKDGSLKSHVPEPVMIALEEAARTWHESREVIHNLAVTDPELAAEVQSMIDASMTTAVAVAEPVVRQEDQSKKVVSRMAADEDLMRRICSRIKSEEGRMAQCQQEFVSETASGPVSIRDRMQLARQERAAAEAELDALI